MYILLLNVLHSLLSASISATVNSTRQALQGYLRCEATGTQAECSATELDNALQTNENLVLTYSCCLDYKFKVLHDTFPKHAHVQQGGGILA